MAFFVEVGLLLLVLPWSPLWEANYFAAIWPGLLPVMTDPFVRGGVSGIGLINLGAGVAEIAGVFTVRAMPSPRLEPGDAHGLSRDIENQVES